MNSFPKLKLTLSMAIFGSVGFFSQQTGLPALELVFVRCICATLFLSLCWVLTGQAKRERLIGREVIQVLACGVFLVLNWVFLFRSFETMSVTISISIYHLAPVFVLILGSFLFREKMTLLASLSILVCFVGTLFVIGIDQGLSWREVWSTGAGWALLAALFYAGTTLLGKGINIMSAYLMTVLQTLLGVFLLLPFVDFSAFHSLTPENWVYIAATGLIHTGFVYYLFFDSLRNLSARIISALIFVDPAVAILLDTVFIGFRPTLLQVAGIVLIFAGMAGSLWKPESRQEYLTS